MNEDRFDQQIRTIRLQLAGLRRHITQLHGAASATSEGLLTSLLAEALVEEIAIALVNLQVLKEEIDTNLEQWLVLSEEQKEQNERLAAEYQQYYDLFEFAPGGYLLTNPQGIILEANCATASLLNVSQQFLVGKPLVVFIALQERDSFRTELKRLQHETRYPPKPQEWKVCLSPRHLAPFDAKLTVSDRRDYKGKLVALRVWVRKLSECKQAELAQSQLIISESQN